MVNKVKILALLSVASSFLIGCQNKTQPHVIEYCNFTFEGTYCTLQGEYNPTFKVVKGEKVQYTFAPDVGYSAPELIDQPASSDYKYENNVGIFSMIISSDITIKAKSEELTSASYSFDFTGTNCKIDGKAQFITENIPITYQSIYTITADSGYKCPTITSIKDKNDISYEEGIEYTYTKKANYGVLQFNVSTPDDIIVTASAEIVAAEYQVVWCFENGSSPLVETYTDGAELNPPETPTKESTDILPDGEQYAYTFTDWNWEGKTPGEDLPATVEQNYTFYAQYKERSLVTKLYLANVEEDFDFEFSVNDSSKQKIRVDWGDGSIDSGKTTHTYTTSFSSCVIRIYNEMKDLFFDYYSRNKIVKAILNNVISIEEEALYNCGSITTVYISDSINSIGDSAFSWCPSLTTFEFSNTITKLTEISESVFNSSGLTSIEIPSSVTSIGDEAFKDDGDLKTITFMSNSNLTSIGSASFKYCYNLESVNIPNSVTSIGDEAFNEDWDLKTITFMSNSNLTSIGGYAFNGCSSLTTINIPNSVTSIGGYAFNGCSSLTTINIPNSVTSITNHAFYGCSSLTTINIPNGVTSIGDGAFYGCSSLTTINIPNSVTSIEQYTFAYCTQLKTMDVSSFLDPSKIPTIYINTTYYSPISDIYTHDSVMTQAFKSADVWEYYGDKIKEKPTPLI